MVPQHCILDDLICNSLWLGVNCFGHASSTIKQQFFSVDPSVVLIHQGLGLFQPIEAITGIGAIKPGDLLESFIYSAPLLIFTFFPFIFCLLFSVLSLLSFFFFLLSLFPSGYAPYPVFLGVPIAFVEPIGLKNHYYVQMD